EGLASGKHAASLCAGRPGVLHGNRTYLLQDANGQITETHSISAGLDYPGVGPEHAWLKDSKRAEYVAVDDEDALKALAVLEPRVLRADPGIVEARRDRMRLGDLAVRVLQEIGAVAVKHAGPAGAKRSGMLSA